MSKFGLVTALVAFTLMSCTNKSNKQADETMTMDEIVVDSHTSEISLDWAGVYTGVMPCADCEGIETVVEFKEDHTFTAKFTYLGNEDKAHTYTNIGTFTWDSNGQIVILKSDNETSQYKVGENHITLLGADGEVNTGKLADFYVLKKEM